MQMSRRAVSNSVLLHLRVLFLLSINIVCATAFGSEMRGRDDQLVSQFRKQHKEYTSATGVTLNSVEYIVATWNADNLPSQLHAELYECTIAGDADKCRKVYSGSVAEELVGIYPFSFSNSGKQQLILLSRSGQLQVLRILSEDRGKLVKIFENGGSNIDVVADEREIWIKNRIGKKIDIYSWDQNTGTIKWKRNLNVVF